MTTTIMTIKKSQQDGWNAYDSEGNLIATINPKRADRLNRYRICWYGGIAHGNISYANDWQEMNDKVSEVTTW